MLQPAWVTMAPDGHIWFHPNGDSWCEDFSCAGPTLQGHFVHEMVHVWQHQQGIDLRLRRLPFARYRYLPLQPGKRFQSYGLEQQAEIVRDAFMLAWGYRLPWRPPLADYARLIPFWAGGIVTPATRGSSSASFRSLMTSYILISSDSIAPATALLNTAM